MTPERRDDWLQDAQGNALAGASVYYCLQPANTGSIPPSPLATVYADTEGDPGDNPQTTDGFGHAIAYLDPSQLYTIVYVHPLFGTNPVVLEDQVVPVPGAASPSSIVAQELAGAIPGTVYQTPTLPSVMIGVFYNGSLQLPGVNYEISGSTVTFKFTTARNSSVFAVYFQ